MGGNSQTENFDTLEDLLEYIKGQIEGANDAGMSLTVGQIKQEYCSQDKSFKYRWFGYYE